MFTDFSTAPCFETTDQHCKSLLQDILAKLDCPSQLCEIAPSSDLFADADWQHSLALVVNGPVAYWDHDKPLYHYDNGDLIGLETLVTGDHGAYKTEFKVELRRFQADVFFEQVQKHTALANLWLQYLLATQLRQSQMLSAVVQPAPNRSFGFRQVSAGETIIQEGSLADEVYSFVEGHADVFCKGVKVGEVRENDIFGAFALLTDQRRTASVVANQSGLLMVVPSEKFETLIQCHPKLCLTLMKNMAQQIINLNEQMIGS